MEAKIETFGGHMIIDSSKILSITTDSKNFDTNAFHEKIRILQLEKFSLDEIYFFLSKVDFYKFPNLFVLKIDLEPNLNIKSVENKLNLLKLPFDRNFLIEITQGNKIHFYLRKRLDKNFEPISENTLKNVIGSNNFFAILKKLNLSLINVDLKQIRGIIDNELKMYKSCFEISIDLSDTLFLNILKLFDLKFTKSAVVETIESKNHEAFLILFDESTKKNDEYFIECVNYENIETFKYLLEKVEINLPTWRDCFTLADKNNYMEFCDELIKNNSFSALNAERIEIYRFHQIKNKRQTFLDNATLPDNKQNMKPLSNKSSNPKKINKSQSECEQRFASITVARPLNFSKSYSLGSQDQVDSSKLKIQTFQPETIEKIISKCRVDSKKCEGLLKITNFVKTLSENSDMQLLLQVIALHDSIIFDFDCDKKKVQSSNYLMNLPEYKNGLTYVTINCDDTKKLSKFAYEIAKNAFKIIFRDEDFLLSTNLTLECEIERLQEFYGVENFNEIEKSDEKLAIYEIFARHFYLTFSENSQINENVQFFFEQFVRPQLQKPDANKILALNRKFCVTQRLQESKIKLNRKSFKIPDDKIIFIKSNIPQAVLESLYYDSVRTNFLSDVKNLFINSSVLALFEIKEKYKEIASSNTISKIFIDASKIDKNTIEILKSVEPKAQIIFVGYDEIKVENYEIKLLIKNFHWSDLSQETQESLLKRKIEFQNFQVSLENVFGTKVDKMSANMIRILCSDEQLVINPQMNDENIAYVPWEFKVRNEMFFNRAVRNFNDDYFYSNNVSIDDLIKKVAKSQIVLLTGDILSGKTNAMKTIAKRINNCEKFVDIFTYDSDKNEGIYLDYIKNKIHRNQEKLAFKEKYEKGNTIIFINEINFRDLKFWKLLEDFKKCKGNQLWIAASDFDGDKIEKEFSTFRVKVAVPTTGEFTRFEPEYESIAPKYFNDFTYEEKLAFQYYALRVYFNTNEEIFGLQFTKDKIKKNSQILESDKNNNLTFKNAFWVEF